MPDIRFRNKTFKTIFLVFAAALAVAGIGAALWKKFEKAGDATGRAVRRKLIGLDDRQKKIINLFGESNAVTNSQVEQAIKGVTRRTLRRDLTELEEMGLIRQHGKTKGSYYTLVVPQRKK